MTATLTEGTPLWNRETVAKAVGEVLADGLAADPAALMAELDKRIGGKPWFDAWQAANADPEPDDHECGLQDSTGEGAAR